MEKRSEALQISIEKWNPQLHIKTFFVLKEQKRREEIKEIHQKVFRKDKHSFNQLIRHYRYVGIPNLCGNIISSFWNKNQML